MEKKEKPALNESVEFIVFACFWICNSLCSKELRNTKFLKNDISDSFNEVVEFIIWPEKTVKICGILGLFRHLSAIIW